MTARTATTSMYVWSLDTDEFRFVTEVWSVAICPDKFPRPFTVV